MNLRLRTLALLALLTLLQGIAPLLHAHVGGQFVRTGAHLHMGAVLAVSEASTGSEALTSVASPQNSFQISEATEVGLGLVIERRLLLVASSGALALPSSPWGLLAAPRSGALWLPVADPIRLRPGRNDARPPPANAPPSLHS